MVEEQQPEPEQTIHRWLLVDIEEDHLEQPSWREAHLVEDQLSTELVNIVPEGRGTQDLPYWVGRAYCAAGAGGAEEQVS